MLITRKEETHTRNYRNTVMLDACALFKTVCFINFDELVKEGITDIFFHSDS